jgi:hypothetical protein
MTTIIDGTAGITYPVVAGGSSAVQASSAKIIQVARFDTGALATGTATIPIDDTIPQITEGTEFMTLAITPSSATNTLIIYVVINTSANLTQYNTIALFQDSTANALASATVHQQNSGAIMTNFSWKMTAGTTSSTTFRVRAGCGAAATTTFNGITSTRLNGGTMASSITIFEVAG